MPAKRTAVPAILLLLPIAAALINTNTFGTPTFTALLGFTILSSLVALLTIIHLVVSKQFVQQHFPLHIVVFCVLGIYIFFHGVFNKNIRLAHY